LYAEYCAQFWDWENSPYIKGKLARGQRIGREYVYHNASYIKNYVKQAFPALQLSQVRTYMLEEFALKLKTNSGLGNSSINAILNAACLPLTEATRLGLIETNPAQGLRKLGKDTLEKGIPTEVEIRKLFALPDLDLRVRCAILLGATCALRLGEVQALKMNNIGVSTLTVSESWGKLDGLKSTKTARVRVLPLPVPVRASLEQLAAENPHGPSGFLFYGLNPDAPLDVRALERGFYAALNRIGITETDRIERRLSFHSLRHWSNAMLRGSLSDAKLRLLTGHSTTAMTSHYDHVTESDMLELSHAQETRLMKYLKIPELDQK
jgi:integrase